MQIDDDMGGLEFKENGNDNIYQYKFNKMLVWDSCKFLHRTQPYKLDSKKERVLVSINLCSSETWAMETLSKCLKNQGNKFNYNGEELKF